MNGKRLLAVAAMGLAIGGSAQGETIVETFLFPLGGSGSMEQTSFPAIGVGVTDGVGFSPERYFPTSSPSSELIEISQSDVGMSWTSDPVLSALILAQFQDDDLNDSLAIFQEAFPGGPIFSVGFVEAVFPSMGLDLAIIASQMDFLRVTLEHFDTEAPNAEHPDWTYSAGFLFEFVSVPAPSAAAPLLIGGAFAARRRRPRA